MRRLAVCTLLLSSAVLLGSAAGTAFAADTPAQKALPRLVDLGAGECIPCKKMAPILDALKQEFAGKLEVEFVDVWKNGGAALKYGIRVIPTQIFFSADGKELFRHEGFYSRADILSWKRLK